MEFFRIIDTSTSESFIQELISLYQLEKIINQLFYLITSEQEKAKSGEIWGEFTLTRNEIKGSLRFAISECPNVICCTITTGYPPAPDAIVLHLTINRQHKNSEFIEEIEEFLEDRSECLNLHFDSQRLKLEQNN
jgi:hypothetical protein